MENKNASEFMVFNCMVKFKDGTPGESICVCLIHKNNALCGSSINSSGGKVEDLSKDVLKLLESISLDDH